MNAVSIQVCSVGHDAAGSVVPDPCSLCNTLGEMIAADNSVVPFLSSSPSLFSGMSPLHMPGWFRVCHSQAY